MLPPGSAAPDPKDRQDHADPDHNLSRHPEMAYQRRRARARQRAGWCPNSSTLPASVKIEWCPNSPTSGAGSRLRSHKGRIHVRRAPNRRILIPWNQDTEATCQKIILHSPRLTHTDKAASGAAV